MRISFKKKRIKRIFINYRYNNFKRNKINLLYCYTYVCIYFIFVIQNGVIHVLTRHFVQSEIIISIHAMIFFATFDVIITIILNEHNKVIGIVFILKIIE